MPLVVNSLQQQRSFAHNAPGSATTFQQYKPLAVKTGFNAAPHQQLFNGVAANPLNVSAHQQYIGTVKPHFNASLHQQEFTPEPSTLDFTAKQVGFAAISNAPLSSSSKKTSFKKTASRNNSSGKALAVVAAPPQAMDMSPETTEDDGNGGVGPSFKTDSEPPAKKWFCC